MIFNSQENDKFERLVQDLYKDMEIPDSTPSWNALQKKLNRRKRKKKMAYRIKIVSGIVCASLIISILISGGSITQRTYAHISDFFHDVIQVFLRKPADDPASALTIPPPAFEIDNKSNGPSMPEKASLEDAQKKLAFPIFLPSFVPEGFSLANIWIFKESDHQYRTAHLEYIDSQNALLKINQRLITDNSSIVTEIHEGTGTIENTMVHEYPAVFYSLPDGYMYLEWIAENVKISISGLLTKSEMLKWAVSLKSQATN